MSKLERIFFSFEVNVLPKPPRSNRQSRLSSFKTFFSYSMMRRLNKLERFWSCNFFSESLWYYKSASKQSALMWTKWHLCEMPLACIGIKFIYWSAMRANRPQTNVVLAPPHLRNTVIRVLHFKVLQLLKLDLPYRTWHGQNALSYFVAASVTKKI